MTITGKIITIKEDSVSNEVVVYVTLEDEKGHMWEKNYTYNTTSPITAKAFKDRLQSDLVADLKPKTYISELSNLIGKEFNITI